MLACRKDMFTGTNFWEKVGISRQIHCYIPYPSPAKEGSTYRATEAGHLGLSHLTPLLADVKHKSSCMHHNHAVQQEDREQLQHSMYLK